MSVTGLLDSQGFSNCGKKPDFWVWSGHSSGVHVLQSSREQALSCQKSSDFISKEMFFPQTTKCRMRPCLCKSHMHTQGCQLFQWKGNSPAERRTLRGSTAGGLSTKSVHSPPTSTSYTLSLESLGRLQWGGFAGQPFPWKRKSPCHFHCHTGKSCQPSLDFQVGVHSFAGRESRTKQSEMAQQTGKSMVGPSTLSEAASQAMDPSQSALSAQTSSSFLEHQIGFSLILSGNAGII